MVHKPFPRVWLAWGKYWAIQAYWYPCISLGVHLDPSKPLIDIHFLWFTLALGKTPQITPNEYKHRHTCRGFLFSDNPIAYL